MTVCDAPALISRESALARRFCRNNSLPHAVVAWLVHGRFPSRETLTLPLGAEPIVDLIGRLPGLVDRHGSEKSGDASARHLHLAKAISISLARVSHWSTEESWPFLQHFVAAAVVPLYRSNHSGRTAEVESQVARSIAEALTVAALTNHLSPEIDPLLPQWTTNRREPASAVADSLNLDLGKVAQAWLAAAEAAFPEDVLLSEPKPDLWCAPFEAVPASGKSDRDQQWQLSAELVARKPHLTLPPGMGKDMTPWGGLTEHWSELIAALSRCQAAGLEAVESDARMQENCFGNVGSNAAGRDRTLVESTSESDESPSSAIPATKNLQLSDRRNNAISLATAPATVDQVSTARLPIVEIADTAELTFIEAVQKWLQVARIEKETLSLAVIEPLPSGTAAPARGIQQWHAEVARVISNHVEIHDARGFVTREGILWILLPNVDRHHAVPIIKSGIEAAASRSGSSPAGPAAEFVPPNGIQLVGGVSTSSVPSPAFKPEGLIAAAWRCLEGARTQGRGNVKSIEVY